MSFVVAPIVEGHGVSAVPVLLRRICPQLVIARPVRIPRSKLVQPQELERAVAIAMANIGSAGALLLVMDADNDCAAELARTLEERMTSAAPGRACRAVLAVREFEAWIAGGIAALAVEAPDAAGRLKDRLAQHFGAYKETADQARLAAQVDLERLTERSRSFRRMRKVAEELAGLAAGPTTC